MCGLQVCDSSTLKLRPCELALSLLCTEFQRQCGKEGKGATSAALMGFISELQVGGLGLLSFVSVVDPNTLNLDQDPGFWPNLDPDTGFYNKFRKKTFKIILEKNNFLLFLLNYKNKLIPKEIFNR